MTTFFSPGQPVFIAPVIGSGRDEDEPYPSLGNDAYVPDLDLSGNADNTQALTDAINAAAASGPTRLMLPRGAIRCDDEIVIPYSNITLAGMGAGFQQTQFTSGGFMGSIRASAGTRIYRGSGGSTAPVLRFTSPQSGERAVGGGIRGLMLDGNGLATEALVVETRGGGLFEDFTAAWATQQHILLSTFTQPVLAQNSIYGVNHNMFRRFYTTSNGLPAAYNAYGLRGKAFENLGAINPDPVPLTLHNPTIAYNTFQQGFIQTWNQHACWLEGFVANLFLLCWTFISGDPEHDTYYGWVLTASEQDSTLGVSSARQNWLNNCMGRIWERSAQTAGLNSSRQNSVKGHHTGTYMRFRMPSIVEPAGPGAPAADNSIEMDVGIIDRMIIWSDITDNQDSYVRAALRSKRVTVDMASGATTVTVPGAIPPGATLIGLAGRVTTQITGPGFFHIGDGADVDRWGALISHERNSIWDDRSWTVGTVEKFPAGKDVVFTANFSTFTGGEIVLHIFYLAAEASYVPLVPPDPEPPLAELESEEAA